MALGECGKVLALLSLAASLLLLADALPFRHHGASSSRLRGGPVVADLLHAALARLDGVSIVDLATRRNMVLLCHAILLVLLGDAGILGVHARRRRQGREASASACYYYYSPPEQSRAVWRRSSSAATNAGLVTALASPSSLTEHERQLQVAEEHVPSAKEIVLVAAAPAAMDDGNITYPMMDSGRAVAADQEEEEDVVEEGEPAADEHGEAEEDLDEMNRRFEAFIATTKEKMRLEALQQQTQHRFLLRDKSIDRRLTSSSLI